MDYGALDLKYIWHPCSQMKDYEELPPIVAERGEGLWLFDSSGKKYLDVISSWWCNLLGHCHPRINSAVAGQLQKLEHVIFANFSNKPAIELVCALKDKMPRGIEKFFFTDNGSAAIEAAMKMSFQYHQQCGAPERTRFMALEDAYHGETLGALSVSGVDLYSKIYRPLLLDVARVPAPDCFRCRFGADRNTCGAECFADAEPFFEKHGSECCAFLVEPLVQAAAGMRIYPPEYLRKLRRACSACGMHLIADEIATGFGRTGTMFACEQAGISPDILCMSKGITGGYMPLAVAAVTEDIYDAFYDDYDTGRAFMHSHTYSGSALACAAGVEVLKIIDEENILQRAAANAVIFRKIISEEIENHKNVGEVRSIGLINAMELVRDRKTKEPLNPRARTGYQIYKKALENGLLLRPLGDVLYFNPPLVINEDEMRFAARVCLDSIRSVLD